jgi:hypothetical protein
MEPMKRRIAPTPGALAQGALAALLALCLVHAAEAAPKKTKARTTTKKKTALTRQQGMRAYIDPVTGRLTRPVVDDTKPAPAASRVTPTDDVTREVPVVRLANGAEMAQLDERFQEFEVVRIGADGRLVRTCVQGPVAADKARQAKPQPAKELQ